MDDFGLSTAYSNPTLAALAAFALFATVVVFAVEWRHASHPSRVDRMVLSGALIALAVGGLASALQPNFGYDSPDVTTVLRIVSAGARAVALILMSAYIVDRWRRP